MTRSGSIVENSYWQLCRVGVASSKSSAVSTQRSAKWQVTFHQATLWREASEFAELLQIFPS